MTICALVKGRRSTILVADGRLSRYERSVSFDTAQKLALVRPRYVYPVISLGRFDRWAARTTREWCLGYAGTYALATQVREAFVNSITNMIVVRDYDQGGKPDFVRRYTPSDNYDDDYNFEEDEFPSIDTRVIRDELKAACQRKGNEWALNRLEVPDAEFLLFGYDEGDGDYAAMHCKFEVSGWKVGEPVIVRITNVGDMSVVAIGAPELASSITWDEKLSAALRESIPPTEEDGSLASYFANSEPSSMTNVERRLVEMVHDATESSVGGNLIVAIGQSDGKIRLRSARGVHPREP